MDMPPLNHVDDPRALFKQQQARERDAIMSVIRPSPPADTLADVHLRVGALDAKLKAAWQTHYKLHPGGRSSDAQRTSLAAVQRIESDLQAAKQRVTELEAADARAELRANPAPRGFLKLSPAMADASGNRRSMPANCKSGFGRL